MRNLTMFLAFTLTFVHTESSSSEKRWSFVLPPAAPPAHKAAAEKLVDLINHHPRKAVREKMPAWYMRINGQEEQCGLTLVSRSSLPVDELISALGLTKEIAVWLQQQIVKDDRGRQFIVKTKPILLVNVDFLNQSASFDRLRDRRYKETWIYYAFTLMENHLSKRVPLKGPYWDPGDTWESRAEAVWKSEFEALVAQWDFVKEQKVTFFLPLLENLLQKYKGDEEAAILDGFHKSMMARKGFPREFYAKWEELYQKNSKKLRRNKLVLGKYLWTSFYNTKQLTKDFYEI